MVITTAMAQSARATFASVAVLVAALLACKDKTDNTAPAPPPAPTAAGPCANGLSADPGQGEFRPAVTAFKDKEYKKAQSLLDTMTTKYPNSATVRV
jgi:TolA-binding protein